MMDLRLGIDDQAFWTDPWRTRKAVQRQLMAGNAEAFVIDAPETVPLDVHDTLPLTLLRVSKVGVESAFVRSAVLTAINLYTGEVSAALAFDPPPPSRGPAGVGGADDAMLGEAHVIDLAKRLQLPLIWGDYLVSLLALDQVSARRRMRVVETLAYEDPAVEAFLHTQLAARLERPRPFPEPDSDPRSILPLYEELDESPPLPAELGVSLAIERVNLLPATQCVVFGSYRLAVEPRFITSGASEHLAPTAIVPITLLLTGSVNPAPRLAKLYVPCRQPLLDGGVAVGHFAIDLSKLVRLGLTPQTFFVYAFSGTVLHGPVPAAFVRIPPVPHPSR